MTQNKKFNFLSSLGVVLFLVGIVFLFIKLWFGFMLFAACFGINLYLRKTFPDDFKRITDGSSMPPGETVYKLKHVEGLRFFDNNSDIKIRMPGDKLVMFSGSQNHEISYSDIEHAAILEEITKDLKDKSVIARALVGGLLLGGVGAVVGGLTAVNPTYKKDKKYYLQIKTKAGEDIILTGKTNVLKSLKEIIVNNV